MLQTTIQMDIGEYELAWLLALEEQNRAALHELLHESFTSTSARSARILRKPEYISGALEARICDHEMKDVEMIQIADLVVVKARLICTSRFRDWKIEDDLLITDVWLRMGDVWQAITRHVSRVP